MLGDLHAKVMAGAAATMELWRPAIARAEFMAPAENLTQYLAFHSADVLLEFLSPDAQV